MTRSELIDRISTKYPSLYLREVEKVVDVFFEEIEKALVNGNRVELRGFGSFGTKERAGRKARNPRNGEKVQVGIKRSPYFKIGKGLFNEINGLAE